MKRRRIRREKRKRKGKGKKKRIVGEYSKVNSAFTAVERERRV